MLRFALRFGIPAALATLFIGLLVMLNRFEIRSKAAVTLVFSPEEVRGYVAPQTLEVGLGDTLCVSQTLCGDIMFVVKAVGSEPAAIVMHLTPVEGEEVLHQRLAGNTLTTGYVFTERVNLRELVFKRARM